MQIVQQNSEKQLIEILQQHWEKNPTHRCLQLKFSQIDIEREHIEHVIEGLNAQLEERTAQAYICHDGDVFVLSRQMTQKRVSDLLAHLPLKTAPASLRGLATLFEIGVDWSRLRTICEKKIENYELLKRTKPSKHQDKIPPLSYQETLKTLDRKLLQSLAMRREQRQQPEIMVVEDDIFSQKLVSNALRNKYSLSMIDDGQGALMTYVSKAPDVLFLDIGLPDISGHEVLEYLFVLDPNAYVVMFSGNGDKDNVMKAIGLGAKGFVGKPFTQEKLIHYIEKSPFIQAKQNKESKHGNLIH